MNLFGLTSLLITDINLNIQVLNRFRRELILLLFLLLSNMVHSQSNFSLTGTVRDNHNRTIEGGTIRLAWHTVLTDSYSNFKIEKIKNSSFEIIAKAIGYDIFKRKIEIKERNNHLDILLFEKTQKIEEVPVTGLTKPQITNRMAFNVTSIDAKKSTRLNSSHVKIS